MNVVLTKNLEKKVRTYARQRGVSEAEYIHTAIEQTIDAENDLAGEMELWERASLQDLQSFAKKRKA